MLAVRSKRSSGPRGLEGVKTNVRCYDIDSDYSWASCLGVFSVNIYKILLARGITCCVVCERTEPLFFFPVSGLVIGQ